MELAPPPRSFYHTDASEYTADKSSCNEDEEKSEISNNAPQDEEKTYSRLPDYYMVLARQRVGDKNDIIKRRVNARDDECWGESNSKKDSGLESGEVSDASEEILVSPCDSAQKGIKKSGNLKAAPAKSLILTSSAKTCSNVLSINGKDYHIPTSSVNNNSKILDSIQTLNVKISKETTMVSVLKKCQTVNTSKQTSQSSGASSDNSISVSSENSAVKEESQGPKKRKLNLQEYRSRVKELDRIRGSRETSRANSPILTVSVGTSTSGNTDSVSKDTLNDPTVVAEQKVTGESNESTANGDILPRRTMQSVEVQTLPVNEVPMAKEESENAKNRDKRRRQYRTRRVSSSSSSSSSSSLSSSCSSSSRSNSRNSRRRRGKSQSRHRRRRR